MPRTIVVTGGSTGIGRATAAAFAAEGDGTTVWITGRRPHVLQEAADDIDGDVRPVTGDASDPDAVADLAARLPGRVDVLVNNAGGNTDFDHGGADDLAGVAEGWLANLRANVISAVLVTTALTDRLPEGGSVVTVGSIAADKGAGSYGAAKAAVASWNVDLATQLGRRGVTANVVSPGYIADTEFFRGQLTDERRRALIDATKTGRVGRPDDIAQAVRFLASPGGRQITGQVIPVNGGEWPTR